MAGPLPKTGILNEEGYQQAWQDAEQLQQSGRISIEQWVALAKILNTALIEADKGVVQLVPAASAHVRSSRGHNHSGRDLTAPMRAGSVQLRAYAL